MRPEAVQEKDKKKERKKKKEIVMIVLRQTLKQTINPAGLLAFDFVST